MGINITTMQWSQKLQVFWVYCSASNLKHYFIWIFFVSIYHYRLEAPILHSLSGSWRGFSVISPPNLNGSRWNPEYNVRGNGAHSHKNQGKSPQGLHLRMPKCVLFLSPIQRRLSATYPAPILTAFETKDVKIRTSAQGFYRSQKSLKWVFSRGVCNKATAQKAQFWSYTVLHQCRFLRHSVV